MCEEATSAGRDRSNFSMNGRHLSKIVHTADAIE